MNITVRYIDEQPIDGPVKRYTLRQFRNHDEGDLMILWAYVADDGSVHPHIQTARQRPKAATASWWQRLTGGARRTT